jgi:hypothetical protein
MPHVFQDEPAHLGTAGMAGKTLGLNDGSGRIQEHRLWAGVWPKATRNQNPRGARSSSVPKALNGRGESATFVPHWEIRPFNQ